MKKKTYKIDVTKKDITDARERDSQYCPIDYATKRTFECETNTFLSYTLLYNNEGDRIGKVELPQKAKDFIDAFDAGKPVKPFSFEVVA